MNKLLKFNIVLIVFPFLIGWVLLLMNFTRLQAGETAIPDEKIFWWNIRSIDTMKLSRDLARQKATDPAFDQVIDTQVQVAVDIGATHLAIGTPYDDEFIPFMTRWVIKARERGLKVWFRGNFAGWEQWFDYPLLTREEHIKKVQRFILNNESLFEDGDLFSTCPECENGGPGDPRRTGDVEAYRRFLIDEYKMASKSFQTIRKDVQSNLFSMNGDVALLVMDKETTAALDGIITVDHYVKDPKKMETDLELYSNRSGGKVVLGEFGAPIPDIHGKISDKDQAKLIDEFFDVFARSDAVVGVNYWVITDGSTELVSIDGKRREGVSVLKKYFQPEEAYGILKDEIGKPLEDIHVQTAYRTVKTNKDGYFRLPISSEGEIATISGTLIQQKTATLSSIPENNQFVLSYSQESLVFKIIRFFLTHFPLLQRQIA